MRSCRLEINRSQKSFQMKVNVCEYLSYFHYCFQVDKEKRGYKNLSHLVHLCILYINTTPKHSCNLELPRVTILWHAHVVLVIQSLPTFPLWLVPNKKENTKYPWFIWDVICNSLTKALGFCKMCLLDSGEMTNSKKWFCLCSCSIPWVEF